MEDTNTQPIASSVKSSDDVKFICPTDGEISQDDVIFLCNHCKQEDLIFQDGIYMCPSCLVPGQNFQCMLCDSKEVKMVHKGSHAKK
jgi:hypothetical protein